MIQQTQWTPDTCGCVLVYEWDDTVPQDQRIHTPVSARACPVHVGLANVLDHHEAVRTENRYKNLVVHEVAKALGWESAIEDPDTGEVLVTEKNPHVHPARIRWSYDGQRQLRIHTAVLLPALATALSDAAKRLPPGSVT